MIRDEKLVPDEEYPVVPMDPKDVTAAHFAQYGHDDCWQWRWAGQKDWFKQHYCTMRTMEQLADGPALAQVRVVAAYDKVAVVLPSVCQPRLLNKRDIEQIRTGRLFQGLYDSIFGDES